MMMLMMMSSIVVVVYTDKTDQPLTYYLQRKKEKYLIKFYIYFVHSKNKEVIVARLKCLKRDRCVGMAEVCRVVCRHLAPSNEMG